MKLSIGSSIRCSSLQGQWDFTVQDFEPSRLDPPGRYWLVDAVGKEWLFRPWTRCAESCDGKPTIYFSRIRVVKE